MASRYTGNTRSSPLLGNGKPLVFDFIRAARQCNPFDFDFQSGVQFLRHQHVHDRRSTDAAQNHPKALRFAALLRYVLQDELRYDVLPFRLAHGLMADSTGL